MNNYQICSQWILDNLSLDNKSHKDIKVLDYGCGGGIIVKNLIGEKISAFGCDVFFEGGDHSKEISDSLFQNGIIKKMEDGKIPYPDNYFDYVVNNQVIEHVEDIELTLNEINRVLKINGKALYLFPHLEVWREGHCGIPFLHWFNRDSKFRLYYALALRKLGFGYFKDKRSHLNWSKDYCSYLDQWTHYRKKTEIKDCFLKIFGNIEFIDDYWFNLRTPQKYSILRKFPSFIKKIITRKLAGLIVVSKKQLTKN